MILEDWNSQNKRNDSAVQKKYTNLYGFFQWWSFQAGFSSFVTVFVEVIVLEFLMNSANTDTRPNS